MRYRSQSPADTFRFARQKAENAKPGDIYCLSGPLGAGKTVFAQGFASGLGFTGAVTSPTFTLMNVYEGGRLPLYHFDLYRLLGGADFLDTGYEDYLFGDGVCLIEWAERVWEYLPPTAVWITLLPDEENSRLIEISNSATGGGGFDYIGD